MNRESTVNFQPLNDMILVRPDPVVEKIGSLFVPQGVLKPGDRPGRSSDCFTGTVVAVGPGDRHKPVRLRTCGDCGAKFRKQDGPADYVCDCPTKVTGALWARFWDKGRYPMQTKVGDRVVYPRRPSMPGGEFSLEIDGERFVMFHEEQFAFAVIEG